MPGRSVLHRRSATPHRRQIFPCSPRNVGLAQRRHAMFSTAKASTREATTLRLPLPAWSWYLVRNCGLPGGPVPRAHGNVTHRTERSAALRTTDSVSIEALVESSGALVLDPAVGLNLQAYDLRAAEREAAAGIEREVRARRGRKDTQAIDNRALSARVKSPIDCCS